MNMLDRAIRDVRRIVSDRNGFTVPITFSTPNLDFELIVNGTAKKHHTAYDELGNTVNSRQASVTVAEIDLTSKGYPVRNQNGEVFLRDHLVTWTDAQGNAYTYKIQEWFPDEHLGLLVIILSNAKYVPQQIK